MSKYSRDIELKKSTISRYIKNIMDLANKCLVEYGGASYRQSEMDMDRFMYTNSELIYKHLIIVNSHKERKYLRGLKLEEISTLYAESSHMLDEIKRKFRI